MNTSKKNGILVEYVEPRLTLTSLTDDIIDTALEREDLQCDTKIAKQAVFCYLSQFAVWDDVLALFGMELQKGGHECEYPMSTLIPLANAVDNIMKEHETAKYAQCICRDAVKHTFQNWNKAKEKAWTADTEFHLVMLLAALVVGGKSYVEEECQYELDILSMTIDELIKFAKTLEEYDPENFDDNTEMKGE